ncbi:MAG: hypothetical protein A2175_02255 [Candidatus Nealsonbacteria bacterium RBG_13_42_11]|uniref:Glycosyltransferase 2-like domain-containing protein n=1 Tax=Candidatus Nealsonbacteria bacterium RBG_13_42_11 TaxID=1801663 RepID=A0A1G2DZU6_9BACT|nr:MAG: hypothetical protein A2175_02255 [Candidatus Nealsonbacteria bacterium RBG_13_42_11]
MENNLSFVSVVIPCWREEKFIGKCLDTIIEQDYPKDKLEVLVIDGMSDDKTREIVGNYSTRFPFIKLLDNPKRFTNFAFNIGIKASKGENIAIMGAHAGYAKDYILKCAKYLKEYRADNVGGVLKTLPAQNTLVAKSIAYCLSSFFGAGGSLFRTGANKPTPVDTVFGGFYKKEIFKKIGLFNENLKRSQDMEFNLRLKKAGGKILLFPDVSVSYYPQITFWNFFKHNFNDGIWSLYPLKIIKTKFKLRHYIPLVFVSAIIIFGILSVFSCLSRGILILIIFYYLLTSLCLSLMIVIREKDFRFLFLMPIAFFCRHFGYGLGSILGITKILTG